MKTELIRMLDNLFLYLSLNRSNFQMVKGIHNQLNIENNQGRMRVPSFMTRKTDLKVQPEGPKMGHNIGLQ